MDKILYGTLKDLLLKKATILFEYYLNEMPHLEIRCGKEIEIDLDELEESLINLVYEIIDENVHNDENEYIGLRLEPKLARNGDLIICVDSIINILHHEEISDIFFETESIIKEQKLETRFDFLPVNYSPKNFSLFIDIVFRPSETTINQYELYYYEDGNQIVIKNKNLLNDLLKKLEEAIAEASYVLLIMPKHKSDLEIKVKIENNVTIVLKEYFYKRQITYYDCNT